MNINTVTEHTAVTRWCPMVRCQFKDNPMDNPSNCHTGSKGEPHTIPSWAKCIASDCMMWRFDPEAPSRGFCGMAGPTRMEINVFTKIVQDHMTIQDDAKTEGNDS